MPAARSVKGFRGQQLAGDQDQPSIKGLASLSINGPYLRRLHLETILRRSIPILILLFVALVGAAISVRLTDQRQETVLRAKHSLSLTADLLAQRLRASEFPGAEFTQEKIHGLLASAISEFGVDDRLEIILTNGSSIVRKSLAAPSEWADQSFDSLLNSSPELVELAARAGVVKTELEGELTVLAAVRSIGSRGETRLFVVQSLDAVEAPWRATVAFFITVFSSTGFVVVLLCGAFYWQAARADQADTIYDETRVRLNTALESGGAGLWDWDIARGRIFWSRSMFNILGFSPSEHIMSVDEVNQRIHPQDIDLYDFANKLMKTDAAMELVDHSFRMRNAEGDWIWLRMRGKLMNEAGNMAAHLVGITLDVTDQQKMSEKLDLSSLELADAIETTSEAFVLWDRDNNMVLCNQTYREFHNLPEDAARPGTSYDEVIKQAGNSVVRTRVAASSDHSRGDRTFETQLEDGRWLKINERRTNDGGYVSVGTDITTLKQHEERLMESERELMATIADLRHSRRTLEEQAQQLINLADKYSREKERAEAASESKSHFLANISHEFRTPLNAVIGFSGIMESEVFGALGSEKYLEYSRDIRESGEFLLNFINDILHMSKIEAGRVNLNPEELVMSDLVAESLRIIATPAEQQQIKVIKDISPRTNLRADRRAVKQVLLNLLSNAVKFTPENGEITIQVRQLQDTVQVKIIDTGIGIPAEALSQLCRPFEQVQNQFTKNHEGSGLGLAISRSLVEMHGGELKLESTEGSGTIVTFTLPEEPIELKLAV